MKKYIANIAIAVIVFIIIAPYALIWTFAWALSIGKSVLLPMAIASLVIYGSITIILILIYKKIENKGGKIIFFIILILIAILNSLFPLFGYHKSDLQKNSSISDCDRIKDTKKDILGETKKDFCYFKVAQRDEDITICDKIDSKKTRKDCYWDVSRDKDSLDYCLKAKEKEECYIGYAVKQSWNSKIDGGISTCKIITDNKLRESCCFEISSLQGIDEKKKERCLQEINKNINSWLICSLF
ncbi:MAG: hypothetical protein WA055_01290 [Candidatus Moraniibacteriota bacterium]